MGNTGRFSTSGVKLRFHLELQQWIRTSSLVSRRNSRGSSVVAAGNSELLQVAVHDLVPLEPWQETHFSSQVGGYTWFLSCCAGASSHDVLGRLASLGMCRLASLLLQCAGDSLVFFMGLPFS